MRLPKYCQKSMPVVAEEKDHCMTPVSHFPSMPLNDAEVFVCCGIRT